MRDKINKLKEKSMEEKGMIQEMMYEVICQIADDNEDGVKRFLQSNPYTSLEFYNFRVLKNNSRFFEEILYCESDQSKLHKKQIRDTIDHPHGKNTFFIVGYQGCGKSTFVHSVINMCEKEYDPRIVLINCEKVGTDTCLIKKSICNLLKKGIKNVQEIEKFLDFFDQNEDVIEEFNEDSFNVFYDKVAALNGKREFSRKSAELRDLSSFINSKLTIRQALYLLLLWNLAADYDSSIQQDRKLMLFIDNIDCVDEYNELTEFISCIDKLTLEMSEHFDKFKLYRDKNISDSFISKIKVFISMREITKANLPSSHFSDAFRNIYLTYDMTEWYDKGEIVRYRVKRLLEFDTDQKLGKDLRAQLRQILDITKDSYTEEVLYPFFNNNYRSAVEMLASIVIKHRSQIDTYVRIMNNTVQKYRHGARGILFKYIFDELNKSDGNEECCFKRIGVLDLLNRKNNEVSICRLILSYLSNYTETKCDSGRNSVSLNDILSSFDGIFQKKNVVKILCEMFALRNSKWSHLVSFNQIVYRDVPNKIESYPCLEDFDHDKTMLHYSCAGKIYIEYVATHFEFFTARIFKEDRAALFCDENLQIDSTTGNFRCCDIINKVFSEVARCCDSLKKFNGQLCSLNHYLDPYKNTTIYIDSPYICMFKRKEYNYNNKEREERRFKQFHEERILFTHINYIDCYRHYVLNYSEIGHNQKVLLNEQLTGCIKKYVQLLASDDVLKSPRTKNEYIKHYEKQIDACSKNWEDFSIEISMNA